jgi:DNA polymerase-1
MRYLIFDTTYLAHKARFSTGSLKFDGNPTGVAFGVLRDIERFLELYSPCTCVFAFDWGGPGLRGALSATYKISRSKVKNVHGEWVPKPMTHDEEEEQRLFHDQCKTLYREILPNMGFKNIFRVKGFEGDDIIAKVAEDLPMTDEGVMVSGDHDMWQCLRSNVSWHAPSSGVVTFASFQKEWGLYPFQWAMVKSIAGCSSDDVEGVPGVGEKTAAKFVLGKLKPDSTKCKAIEANLELMRRNKPLVTLPFYDTPSFTLQPDEYDQDKKRAVYLSLGI